jgi:EAL domain-containing protein (putative c-di-GMP-specific phosphodiesterase class I)/GGDEF domain-containing protein
MSTASETRTAPRLTPEALAALFARAGIGSVERIALRSFARRVSRYDLVVAFAEALGAQPMRPMSDDAMHAEARLCEALLEVIDWDFEARWLDGMVERWLDCYRAGVPADLPWRACGALLAGCRTALTRDREHVPREELGIVAAIERIVGCVAALLADAVIATERRLRGVAERLDRVTGLPGRRAFTTALAAAPGEGATYGVLVVAIVWGDAARALAVEERDALRHLASRQMLVHVRPGDRLFALGEDEWALLLPRLANPAQIPLAGNRLVAACTGLLEGELRRFRGRVAAGGAISTGVDAGRTVEQAARTALLAALGAGVRCEVYRPEIGGAVQHDVDLERDFLHDLRSQRLQVWLQPQVTAHSRRCAGAEALLRWQRESGDWVAPTRIIAMAEKLGVMPELRHWLISRVARMAGDLAHAGVPLRVSLNVTAEDIRDDELPDVLAQALALWKAEPAQLVVELTEGALVEDDGHAIDVINRLRTMGCRVSLDDFGTGFSSLAYLRQLPVTELKIDQVFVRGMLANEKDWAIVESVVGLAKGFGLELVAEGVEDEATRDALEALGCHHIQGFLVAQAMPWERFVAWHAGFEQRRTGLGRRDASVASRASPAGVVQ